MKSRVSITLLEKIAQLEAFKRADLASKESAELAKRIRSALEAVSATQREALRANQAAERASISQHDSRKAANEAKETLTLFESDKDIQQAGTVKALEAAQEALILAKTVKEWEEKTGVVVKKLEVRDDRYVWVIYSDKTEERLFRFPRWRGDGGGGGGISIEEVNQFLSKLANIALSRSRASTFPIPPNVWTTIPLNIEDFPASGEFVYQSSTSRIFYQAARTPFSAFIGLTYEGGAAQLSIRRLRLIQRDPLSLSSITVLMEEEDFAQLNQVLTIESSKLIYPRVDWPMELQAFQDSIALTINITAAFVGLISGKGPKGDPGPAGDPGGPPGPTGPQGPPGSSSLAMILALGGI